MGPAAACGASNGIDLALGGLPQNLPTADPHTAGEKRDVEHEPAAASGRSRVTASDQRAVCGDAIP
jgi:hypothetical protein